MTELTKLIARRIALHGPISIAEYMAEALMHPRHGYYMRGDPFGVQGDFITAPEMSQMFGELIGLWCAELWRQLGQPVPFRLVEFGPGRGTLMADALRAARRMPGFIDAVAVELIEASPPLREIQQKSLESMIAVSWHDDFATVPTGPLIVIANEFFDALPVLQFERRLEGWRERLVTMEGDRFCFVLGPPATPRAALIPKPVAETAPVGSIAEVSPATISLATTLAQRIDASGGGVLVIDYGRCESTPGPTLRAMRRHASWAVLEEPGEADLTAHVDFAAMAQAARSHAAVHGPVTQSQFLRQLGIELRCQQLLRQATPEQAKGIVSARQRLIDPAEMGTLFKVLAFTRHGTATPPGFEESNAP